MSHPDLEPDMTQELPQDTPTVPGRTERTLISCPGCGRHDYVQWPAGQATCHWKCFNCGKESDLSRRAGH